MFIGIILIVLLIILWVVKGWQDLVNGWRIITNSFLVFKKYPQFIVPLIIQQVVSAPILLYLAFGNGRLLDTYPLQVAFLALFFIALLLTVCCLILLELIEQIETNQPVNFWAATKQAFVKDGFKALPLVVIWTIIWFILLIIEALLSKKKGKGSGNFTAENSAKVLEGASNTFSEGILATLEKGIRMMVFFILPGIAWKGLSFGQATKQAFHMVRGHLNIFLSGFVLSTIVQAIIFLPAGIVFALSDSAQIQFPVWVWVITIFYIFLAWSYTIYTEQMFSATLYLWDLKWQKAVQETPPGNPVPKFTYIQMPSLLNETADLLDIIKTANNSNGS